MTSAVTPPNPDQTDSGRHGNPPQSVPDPTLMTIDALRREIAMLESSVDAKSDAKEELNKERFHRVDSLLERAEQQRIEQKNDTKAAVDAALASQKESAMKMEKSIADQIKSLTDNFNTAIRGVHSNIADLKDRMTIIESMKQGAGEQKTGLYATIGVFVALLLATLAVIGFLT